MLLWAGHYCVILNDWLWGVCWAVPTQDNYPYADLTVLDLSPYYLQEARANLRYWADMRAPAKGAQPLGGPDGTGTSYLQAAAEAIPQPDASYDVVRSAAFCRSNRCW